MTYGDPDSHPPRYQNWNLSVQRSLTSSLVVTAAYVGSNGKQLARRRPRQLVKSDGSQISGLGESAQRNATPANVAPAQAIVPGVRLPFPTFSGQSLRCLRPFPQYNSVADPYGNVGQSNYNALQLSLQQRLSNGLTFNLNYTFSKALGTINGIRSAYMQEKNLSTTDQPHVFNAFYSYELPFGKGRMFNPENKSSGRWLVAGRFPVSPGSPRARRSGLSRLTAMCRRRAPAGPITIRTLPVRGINGDWGNGNVRPVAMPRLY